MPDPIEIVVAGEPVAKGRPRMSVRPIHGKPRAMAYTPAKTRDYENLIKLAAGQAMGGAPPASDPVRMTVRACLPIPRSLSKKRQAMAEAGELRPAKRPDIDNFVKAALDGCNKIVFVDDSQVVELTAVKAYSRRPRLEIRIEAVG